MKAKLDEQNVITANAQFWEQMVSMSLETVPSLERFCLDAGHMSAVVALKGVWNGRIEVRMTNGLAYEATAAMTMQALDTVAEADALDATREITNMIAGTIKSSLPRPCSMTVPQSSVELQEFCGQETTDDSLVVAFRHKAGDMMVLIWEQECTQHSG
jgi:CheY-specific phosphatase CheX